MTHEQTIRASATCTGVGLHSGAPVTLRILPAPAGTGIVFRRTDLESFEIEASGRNVARVSYATSLMKKGVLISTTEHLLSAFIGAGIDNAIVELDNLELPILDGSARPFVDMIQKAGIRRQRKIRTYLRIVREVELREGDKFIAVYPASTYSVSYSINFPHPQIGRQTFCVQLTNGSYVREIAPARTFGFMHEAEAMRQQGLILGDLALIGKQILGSVVADRAGHAMHTALVSRLLRDKSYWEETTLEEASCAVPVSAEARLSV